MSAFTMNILFHHLILDLDTDAKMSSSEQNIIDAGKSLLLRYIFYHYYAFSFSVVHSNFSRYLIILVLVTSLKI